MFTLIKLIIAILVLFKVIPKNKLMSNHEITLLEDEIAQLKRASAASAKINILQTDDLVKVRRNYLDMEKQYHATFLLEQDGQALIKKQAAQISEQTKQINAYEKDAEVAIEEFNALQDDLATATDLSKRLKEALTKWTS
mgnify:FL=1|tara:strand:- start:487 stop:906 length:420 start_codon:yes stop_codon:yes gene_type:complete